MTERDIQAEDEMVSVLLADPMLLRQYVQKCCEMERRHVSSQYVDDTRWIPASRPPSGKAAVLVAYNGMWKPSRKRHWTVLLAKFSGGKFRFLTTKDKTRKPERVKYWMPLPSTRGCEGETR